MLPRDTCREADKTDNQTYAESWALNVKGGTGTGEPNVWG
jgi:hypothetical protein